MGAWAKKLSQEEVGARGANRRVGLEEGRRDAGERGGGERDTHEPRVPEVLPGSHQGPQAVAPTPSPNSESPLCTTARDSRAKSP